jgi:hypothetical protein
MRFHLSLLLLFVWTCVIKAQVPEIKQPGENKYQINWSTPISSTISENEVIQLINFSSAHYSFSDGFLPRHYQQVEINGNETAIAVSLVDPVFQPLTAAEVALIKSPLQISSEIKIDANVYVERKQKKGVVSFIPIRKNAQTGKFEKLISYDLTVSSIISNATAVNNHAPTTNSILQSGKWYKIAVTTDGIYKLSYAFLKTLGIDVDVLNPKKIRIYGNGGGMLPKLNSAPRADDLLENAIVVEGEADGVFNKEDYVLFYGQAPNRWKYSSTKIPAYTHEMNLYSDSTYYFINVDKGAGKRILTQGSSSATVSHVVNSFDDYAFHESNDKNLISSGNQWFGEFFDNIDSYDFSFNFPFVETTSPAVVKVNMAARSENGSSSFSVSSQSGSSAITIPSINGGSYEYAQTESTYFDFNPSNPVITVNITKQTPSAIGWLDYVEVNVRRRMVMSGNQLSFRDVNAVGPGHIAKYALSINSPVSVWDVTDPHNVYLQNVNATNTIVEFVLPADTLKEFVAFNGLSYLTPVGSGIVENQDLHGLSNKDYIIVAHPDFYAEALQLAAIHEKHDNLKTVVVTPQQIYNEFSSGAQDITAIRDFVRMFYNRATTISERPKYLLLFGDGSYNNKKGSIGNTNFIPTYESDNSVNLTASFVSDDFYGLLDSTEGVFSPNSQGEAIDIGIGRFPVKTKSEAQAALNKVINYIKTGVPPTTTNNGCSNNQSSPFGDWRNQVCFIADDDDSDLHLLGAEKLADTMGFYHNEYNIDKIYLDAYKQESTPGGERYPDVNDAIDKRIEKGCLILNYTGHGGEVGLAHERVVDISMINKWSNFNNLPVFFTATCEFSRYDDPNRTSAGEYAFLNPKGGAIALFTTVRLVYASFNSDLNESFFKAAFTPVNGIMPRLGDIFQIMKSQPGNLNLNSRNFSLLGDPALQLVYPKYDVITDSINNIVVTSTSTDTLKALSLVTVTGHIETNGSPLNNYNGVLYPTVYNKTQNITTLANNPPNSNSNGGSPPYTFAVQKNILYKGKVSVTNGYFKFEFIIPKDIAFQYGIGRISYYAENGFEDANGYYKKIVIGGVNDSAGIDKSGPEIGLYMNDVKFIAGGLTNEKPDLFAILKDANGVNTVGNGIGHDITAVLDANTDHSIILNDYYQADLNSYKSGTIRYPFKDLGEGKHTLNLKVWDVYNNSSQSATEFVVSQSPTMALNHVLNYPNPFTTKTQFFFEHNQCCQLLNIQLQIFTVSGKLVKNLNKFVQAEGYRSDPIEWDGRDDFGDKIGKGVYIYRLKVKTSQGATAEKYEKLVILN